MTCSVVLPWPPKELNPNKRLHWSTKRKHVAKYRAMCFALAREAGIAVDWDGDVHLWVDFYPPDKRRRDDDNVIAAFKAGRDGLADALRIDDSRFRLHPFLQTKTGGFVLVKMTKGV